MYETDDWVKQCLMCQHCYQRNSDDDTLFCRKRNGKCEYKGSKYPKSEHETSNRVLPVLNRAQGGQIKRMTVEEYLKGYNIVFGGVRME